MSAPAKPVFQFGPFRLDPHEQQLWCSGEPITVTRKAFDVLVCLVERSGQLVTKEELLRSVWHDSFVEEAVLSVNISALRKALGDDRNGHSFIETVPRRGYRFVALVTQANSIALPCSWTAAGTGQASQPRKYISLLTAGLLLVIAMAAWRWTGRVPTVAPQSEWSAVTDFSDSVVQPAVSPDGRSMVFIRGPEHFITKGQIYVRQPNGDTVQLTNDRVCKMAPVFTPDGSKIAYTGIDEKFNWNTYVVPVQRGEPQLLLSNAEGLKWIGERRVLFSEIKHGMQMALVTAGDSRTEQRDVYVPPTDRGMAHHSALSPDSEQVLMTEMGSAGEWLPCRVVPFDGSSAGRQIGPPRGRCQGIAWSPDGRWMYLNVDTGNGFHIWRQRFPRGEPEQVTFGPTEQHGIAMAPDGKALYTAVGSAHATIWLHRPHEADHEISAQGSGIKPQFSPDSAKLFYLRPIGALTNRPLGKLVAVDLTNSQVENLFADFAAADFAFSPDGKRLAFGTTDNDGKNQIWTALLDRRSSPQLVPLAGATDQPVFAADDEIYFRSLEDGRHFLERVRLDGSNRRRVIPEPIIAVHSVSPDRRWVVVMEPSSGERSTLRTSAHSADGSRAVVLCDNCGVLWSPTGNLMYFNFTFGTDAAVEGVALPTVSGSSFPALPPNGLTVQEAVKLPGAKRFDRWVQPSSAAGLFAYEKKIVQRNIYRIPLR